MYTKLLLAAVYGLGGVSALAQTHGQAVALYPKAGQTALSVTKATDVEGRCGDATVAIKGIDTGKFENDSTTFSFDFAKEGELLMTRSDGKSISYRQLLSDYNVVQCAGTARGFVLVVGSTCSGSVCSDQVNYRFVDVKTGKVRSAPSKTCDEECANKTLGMRHFK